MVLLYPKLQCEVGCQYCFEAPDRYIPYDKEKMVKTLLSIVEEEKNPSVCLHGGEVLNLPLEDFEFFVKSCRELNIQPSIQTSLMTLKDEHIRIFKKYGVNVGVSLDGPPEFNIFRGPRNPEKNKKFQQDVLNNLQRLKDVNIGFGTITVLSKVNATEDKIDRLIEWAVDNKLNGRFNAMFAPDFDSSLSKYELSNEELSNAWRKLAQASFDTGLCFLPIREMVDNLMGFEIGSCIFSRCDGLTTVVKLILPDGEISSCDRCLQSGAHYREKEGTFIRSEMLKQTDCLRERSSEECRFEECSSEECRYFEICGGGCPSETVGNDPRNKTRFCEAIYNTYDYLEKRLRNMFPNIVLPGVDEPDWFSKVKQRNQPSYFGRMMRSTWRRDNLPPNAQQNNEQKCKILPQGPNTKHVNVPHADGWGKDPNPFSRFNHADGWS